MNILGISAYYHDSAAALIQNGEIISAAQEERFTRKKHDAAFPTNALKYCLSSASLHADEIDYVVFYEKPILKFDRIFETYFSLAPKGWKNFNLSFPIWTKDKLFQSYGLKKSLSVATNTSIKSWNTRLKFSDHHLSHAASAFFPSPFRDAAVLTVDGVGEWATTTIGFGSENNLQIDQEIHFPHSLGLLYSAFTYYAGFKVNSGEYKLMGLAPYGNPIYTEIILDNLIKVSADGSYKLNLKYFEFATGDKMVSNAFCNLFGGAPRQPETQITQKELDLAASIQKVLEDILLLIAGVIRKKYKTENLCLAGGVALNCVANAKLKQYAGFRNIWIQPAAGDAGGALGAALAFYYSQLKNERKIVVGNDSMNNSLLGPEYSASEAKAELDLLGANYIEVASEDLFEIVAQEISEGKAIGWMQGRMEFGPRALGNRSILADPRNLSMQKNLNLKIKFRESFRPFAPSVIQAECSDWFNFKGDSKYMLLVAPVLSYKKEKPNDSENLIDRLASERTSLIPAVTHIDGSARIQTVSPDSNLKFYNLLKAFKKLTGCPLLVNTSFNVRGEPIVCDVKDAFSCFMHTGIDILVVGNLILYKEKQNFVNTESYIGKYELD
jgi:carbamoyltransferase